MYKKIFILVLCLIVSISSAPIYAYSQSHLDVTAAFNRSSVEAGGEFNVDYVITNFSQEEIVVRITERIRNIPNSFITEIIIAANSSESISGRTFLASGNESLNILDYSIDKRPSHTPDTWVGVLTDFLIMEIITPSIMLSANYKVNHPANMLSGQQAEFTATIRSDSNITLRDILVEDSSLGTIGVIEILEPGQSKTVTRSITLNQSIEGYLTVRFVDPTSRQEQILSFPEAKISVVVMNQQPLPRLVLTGETDKMGLSNPEEVTFNLRIRNDGNVDLSEITLFDWNGNRLHNIAILRAGEQASYVFKALVSPGQKFSVRVIGRVPNANETVESSAEFAIAKLEPSVEILREQLSNDTVELKYTVRNTGNVALESIVIEELEKGVIAEIPMLLPGETNEFSVEIDANRQMISRPVLIAKNVANQTVFRFEAEELIFGSQAAAVEPEIAVSFVLEPDRLNEPGTVRIETTIRNVSGINFRNIVITLNELSLRLGTFEQLSPGEEHTFFSEDIFVDSTQNFTITVSAEDDAANTHQFTSDTLVLDLDGVNGSTEIVQTADEAREAFLRTVLGVIIVLGILTVGFLVYILKNPSLTFKKKRRQQLDA